MFRGTENSRNSVPNPYAEEKTTQNSVRNSECTFFRGITETVPSLFRGVFSERNSVPTTSSEYNFTEPVFLALPEKNLAAWGWQHWRGGRGGKGIYQPSLSPDNKFGKTKFLSQNSGDIFCEFDVEPTHDRSFWLRRIRNNILR